MRKRECHGESRPRSLEYRTWEGMIQRCCNPRYTAFSRYGGAGIKVCSRWRRSYLCFLADMGRKPGARYTLERINSRKGYFPGNCRWATRAEQMRNISRNRWLTFRGRTLCITDWCREYGIQMDTLRGRLERGWSIKRALLTPAAARKRTKPKPVILTHHGRTMNLSQWSKELGIEFDTLWRRLKKWGWPVERALSTPVRRQKNNVSVRDQ